MKRTFCPCEKWIYYKIYTSYNQQQSILINNIHPLINQFIKIHLISKFFFIRYIDDNGEHLRIRFLLTNSNNLKLLLNFVNKSLSDLLNNSIIKSLVIDSYKRELERYPLKYYTSIESLFYLNSLSILNLLDAGKKDEKNLRIFNNVDKIVSCLQLNNYEKHLFYEDLFSRYVNKLEYNKSNFIKQTSSFFAGYKDKIAFCLNEQKNLDSLERNQRKILLRLKSILAQDIFRKLIVDLIHMSINRFSIKQPNLNEVLIYYCLSKLYISFHKKTRHGK